MTKYFFIIFLLLGAITYTLFFSEKPQIPEIEDLSSEANLKIKSPSIIAVSANDETQDKKNDDGVPWTELQDKWHEDLKDLLVSLDPSGGEELFERYFQAKKEFELKIGPLREEKAKYVKLNQKNDSLDFSDKQRFIEIDKASDEALIEFKSKIKEILGTHYPVSRRLYRDHLEAIQAHHNGDGRIGLDPAFEAD